MNGVFIIPTGVGAAIGGHAGDATPAAKLIAECCDKLIIHPNVVNASDINEMTPNMLYVEGSILDRFLERKLKLQEVRQNKILVVANKPVGTDTINATHAAEATIGINIKIVELSTRLEMIATMEDGIATGDVRGWKELVLQIRHYNFDALAIHTPILVSREVALNYYKNGGINPWGGVEAKASKLIADVINRPVAHAPVEFEHPESDPELFYIHLETVVNKRIAAEVISNCYLHCVLKGLHKAPRIIHNSIDGFSLEDIDFLISPDLCYGRPHKACQYQNIPIIVVKENRTEAKKPMHGDGIQFVDNYLAAAGLVMSMKAGINPKYVTAY